MTPARFRDVFDRRVKDCEETLVKKADEYARGGDVLHNFKRAAGAIGKTPELALTGMWIKQVISLIDLAHDIDQSGCAAYSVWDEKIRDVINYAILLDALVMERLHAEQGKNWMTPEFLRAMDGRR